MEKLRSFQVVDIRVLTRMILIFSLASSSKFRRTQCPNSRLTTFTSCDVKDITLRTKGVGIE